MQVNYYPNIIYFILALPCATSHTNPVKAGFAAELVGTGCTEVVIRPERLVQGGDEVEQSLPAAFIT